MSVIKTVLFDLDGTLIDTAPDMANALNLLLAEENQPSLSYEVIRPVVSNGSAALVQLGFANIENPQIVERLKKRYLEIYQQKLCVDSKLFPGMSAFIKHIENRGINWGVVTNKPSWLTDPLMQQLNLAERATCVVSGDTTANRKPHPEPMYLACQQANSAAQDCIYIGDAQRDIQAGINAGMLTVIARYGYIGEWEDTTQWGADYCIDSPDELLALI
ncbi:Similar to phosphoglycolate phosphatase, clustered with ubiquinone biosynthesis SAM-dependent O-methyltransferase [hydrothermal vent metagenome]|uniref:Similar to phosphoglycolate phosphatase, clustered with ubiquinone biosynthesis SAM-dependent O-methyltransferase n=1 Tax=hydrothermal vent metagenome TaxID=652676 RepID=A0A3B0XKS9_9ZZZZ